DLPKWKAKAFAESRPTAQIQALLALARTSGKDLQNEVLSRLNRLPFKQLTEEQLLDALRVYHLAFIRMGGKAKANTAIVTSTLSPLFPAQSEFVNRELANVLVYLEEPTMTARAMQLLNAAQTQEDQLFYVFVLRNQKNGWSAGQRRAYFSWLNLAETKYKG